MLLTQSKCQLIKGCSEGKIYTLNVLLEFSSSGFSQVYTHLCLYTNEKNGLAC